MLNRLETLICSYVLTTRLIMRRNQMGHVIAAHRAIGDAVFQLIYDPFPNGRVQVDGYVISVSSSDVQSSPAAVSEVLASLQTSFLASSASSSA